MPQVGEAQNTNYSRHYEISHSLEHGKTLCAVATIAGLILAGIAFSPAVVHAVNLHFLEASGAGLAIPGILGLSLLERDSKKVEDEKLECNYLPPDSPVDIGAAMAGTVDEAGTSTINREEEFGEEAVMTGHDSLMLRIRQAIMSRTLDAQDPLGTTLLEEAVYLHDTEAIECILGHGGGRNVDPKAFHKKEMATLIRCCKHVKLMAEIEKAIESGTPEEKFEMGKTLQNEAILLRDQRALQRLGVLLNLRGLKRADLKSRIDQAIANGCVNGKGIVGETLLHEAASLDDKEAIEHILANGGAINITDNCNRTPLHWAALHSSSRAYHCLCAHSAQEDILDTYGNVPVKLWGKNLKKELIDLGQ